MASGSGRLSGPIWGGSAGLYLNSWARSLIITVSHWSPKLPFAVVRRPMSLPPGNSATFLSSSSGTTSYTFSSARILASPRCEKEAFSMRNASLPPPAALDRAWPETTARAVSSKFLSRKVSLTACGSSMDFSELPTGVVSSLRHAI